MSVCSTVAGLPATKALQLLLMCTQVMSAASVWVCYLVAVLLMEHGAQHVLLGCESLAVVTVVLSHGKRQSHVLSWHATLHICGTGLRSNPGYF